MGDTGGISRGKADTLILDIVDCVIIRQEDVAQHVHASSTRSLDAAIRHLERPCGSASTKVSWREQKVTLEARARRLHKDETLLWEAIDSITKLESQVRYFRVLFHSALSGSDPTSRVVPLKD